jgi:hypothetical protein
MALTFVLGRAIAILKEGFPCIDYLLLEHSDT